MYNHLKLKSYAPLFLAASAASRVAFMTFSRVKALAKSPLTLTFPVMKALAGASSRLKIFKKTSSFIEMVTSAFVGASPEIWRNFFCYFLNWKDYLLPVKPEAHELTGRTKSANFLLNRMYISQSKKEFIKCKYSPSPTAPDPFLKSMKYFPFSLTSNK